MKTPDFTIIGGGIAGLGTAIALQQKGFSVELFESAPEIRAVGAGISLAPNAVKAMRALGLEAEVTAKSKVLGSMDILSQNGKPINAVDTQLLSQKYHAPHLAIHRADLHQILLSKVQGDVVRTGKRAVSAKQNTHGVEVTFHDGSSHQVRALIVADGIHSPIRKQMVPGSEPRYAGYTCWRAVIDYPEDLSGAATETWGPKGRFGIVPLPNKQVYWFACINAPANDSRCKNFTVVDLLEQFRDYHEPIPGILQHTRNEDLLWNDIADLKPIPQYAFDRLVFIGDAGHATTPNLGQGACQALEDALVLSSILGKNRDVADGFHLFDVLRKKRTHYVVNRSWMLGKLAQVEQPMLAGLRNTLLRMAPTGAAEKQMAYLYDVVF